MGPPNFLEQPRELSSYTCRAECSQSSTGQAILGHPGTSFCPYVCENGVQSLRLKTEMIQPVSSHDPYFSSRKGNFQSKHTSYEHILATGGQVSNGAIAVSSINNTDGVGAGKDSYTQYCGDGSKFPTRSAWVSFENMFNDNKQIMFSSCSQYSQANDDGPEVGSIYNAIQQVAVETKVDHRFILAIIMQESGGCVRVPTSNYGVRNPGLMQDHNGNATCNSDITGVVQNPCPQDVVTRMVREGSAGTNDGDGLAQCINESGKDDVTAFYIAARLYNSGAVDGSGDLCKGIATHCYSSDIANRLTGWVEAPHGCSLDG
ncbi:hypothetical protein HO173_009530 [Letharia columbiana]|uniref:Uncharacterized protein n=1 Tax=Letharia columbiana TaxID=112416 RepID=A0A8H6FP81_9LECA|nr:uncharacterized protein HO173_009530 [Letharia columbiana]KAF6232147.1 hypothetical protein HO173_009530 [Letharia columbiana]